MNTIFSWRQLRLAFAVVIAGVLALAGLAMPSQAETTVGNITKTHGSLTIHKHEQPAIPGENIDGTELNPPLANPLENVQFTVRQVANIDLSTADGWAAAQAAVKALQENDTLPTAFTEDVRKDVTSEEGTVSFADLPIGLYLVEETDHGDNNIISEAAPFLVAIPQPLGNGEWNYNVHVYPKNALLDAPDKEVNDEEAFKLGDIVDWTITASVPVLAQGDEYTSYIITDQLDSRLGFAGATVNLNGLPLDAGDYTITPAVNDPTTAGELVTITLTESGLANLNALGDAGTITVDLQTEVLSIGETGIIPNQAIVFINDPNQDSDGTPTDIPDTKWGALEVTKKVKDQEQFLQGAKFDLYVNNGTPELGEPVLKDLITGEDGTFLVEGLKAGEYLLVETEAPAGFEKLVDPIPVTIEAGSVASPNVYTIDNVQQPPFELPLTGGIGTMGFSIAGLALLALAGASYLLIRQRRQN